MAFSAEEQKIFDFAKSALPKWYFQDSARAEEEFGAFVKSFDGSRAQIKAYFDQSLIAGADGTGADYLNQHAKDRGTSRRDSETDPGLRLRLKNIEDALTRPLLIQQAQVIIDDVPIVGTVAMVELRRDKAFFGDSVADGGGGGTFELLTGIEMKFTPSAGFALPVLVEFEESGMWGPPNAVFSLSTSSGNNGTFAVKRLDGDGVVYDNASGVAEAAAVWKLNKRDIDGNERDGRARAYFSRGYRMGSEGTAIIMILPFGCTTVVSDAVEEAVRQKKGAGVLLIVECRQNP